MKWFRVRDWALALAVTTVGFFGAEVARALSVAPMFGRAPWTSQASCFASFYGDVVNQCTSVARWEMYLHQETPGYKTIKFWAKGDTAANNVGCGATSWSEPRNAYTSTGWTYLSTFGAWKQVTLPNLLALSDAGLVMTCELNAAGRLGQVSWTPQ
jgi:hypothetical protein